MTVRCKVWRNPDDPDVARPLLERYEALLRDKVREFVAMSPIEFRATKEKHRDARSFVIRQLAIEDGVAKATMKHKLIRARQALRADHRELDKPLRHPHIDTFGLPAPQNWVDNQGSLRLKFISTHRHIGNLTGALDAMFVGFSYPNKYRESLRTIAEEFTRRLASFAPAGLCCYCKGLEPYQSECRECDKTGICVASQRKSAPEELKTESPLRVMWRGELVELRK